MIEPLKMLFAIEKMKLERAEKAVLQKLVRCSDPEGRVGLVLAGPRGTTIKYPASVALLGQSTSYSKSSILRATKSLQSKGYITKDRPSLNGPNVYQLTLLCMSASGPTLARASATPSIVAAAIEREIAKEELSPTTAPSAAGPSFWRALEEAHRPLRISKYGGEGLGYGPPRDNQERDQRERVSTFGEELTRRAQARGIPDARRWVAETMVKFFFNLPGKNGALVSACHRLDLLFRDLDKIAVHVQSSFASRERRAPSRAPAAVVVVAPRGIAREAIAAVENSRGVMRERRA